MLDRDLARLYEVETRVLNQAVKRNIERFPENFMFQLTHEEFEELEHCFIQHCKDNQADIRELREAMDLLIDRTKPTKIGFKTD